jgi:hypothetical protein
MGIYSASSLTDERKSGAWGVDKPKEESMSLGEDRVRVKFNPSDNSQVSQIKQKSAELIDLCDKARNAGSADHEQQRLWSLAQTDYESAAMWAVKAATF